MIQTNKSWKKMEGVDQKIPDTCRFIVTQDISRLTKIKFSTRIADLATKNHVENTLALGEKNKMSNVWFKLF